MNQFTARYASSIRGVLSGFDRVLFRGTIRRLAYLEGIYAYLSLRSVLIKDFGAHAQSLTERVKAAAMATVTSVNRPVLYVGSSQASKEEIARTIAHEQAITDGPICLLKSVEPCTAFDVYRNRDEKRLQIIQRTRKCLHLYRYEIHPVFGFMHIRLQTWFPFSVQVCINGREWLACHMDTEGLGYVRRDNCFLNVSDFARAQQLLDGQLKADWSKLLDATLNSFNPLHEQLFHDVGGYYWTAQQSEWATDVVFEEPDTLRRLYPMLIRHGMTTLGSPDVMRFLGRRVNSAGQIDPRFQGEVTSDIKVRQEGVRIKHKIDRNFIKAYDKAYTSDAAVLRAETTINNGTDFRVHRPKEGDPKGQRAWRVLRKGVADMHRRAEVSNAANDRYLDALSSIDDGTTFGEAVRSVIEPTKDRAGKRVRALRPLEADDAALLQAVGRGEFTINGLRNRDIVRLLYGPTPGDPQTARRRSRRVTRQLRLLKAHGIITKVQRTHRYQITASGRQIINAVTTAQLTPIRQLLPLAA
jgi:hypothetical protein